MYHETEVQTPMPMPVDWQDMVPRSRVDELQHLLDDAIAETSRVRHEFENFKRRVTERMHREADRRQWCSEYDDIMEEMGLERRSREWDVEVTITATFNRQIMARDEDRARNLVSEELPIRDGSFYNLNGTEVYITEVQLYATQNDD